MTRCFAGQARLAAVLAAALAALLLLGARQAQASGATDEAAVLARIQAGIGDARCSSDAQCRTLPIGEKACGGPERWMAWSTQSPQAAKLPAWAAELSQLVRQRNQRSGMVGNCMVQPDPGAVCRAQHCVMVMPLAVR